MNSNIAARPQKLWRNVLIVICVTYAATFLAWRLLVASPLYSAWWWLQVSEIFGLFTYVPAPFLLVGAMVQRSRIALLVLVVPLLWFGVEYGPSFLPKASVARASVVRAGGATPPLRVLTWNTMRQIGFTRNAVPALKPVADSLQPDFIFLQESGPNSLAQMLPLTGTWPYQMAGRAGGRVYLAFASKWPIVAGEVDEARDGCFCIRMTVAWEDQLVDVLAAHAAVPEMDVVERNGIPILLNFDTTRQELIFDALVAEVTATNRPLIIAGDLNTNERQPNYARLLEAGMHNAHAESGWGFGLTFPRPGAVVSWVPFAVLRIDHIFYNAAWSAERAWTGTIRASDHLYLVADLHLRNPP